MNRAGGALLGALLLIMLLGGLGALAVAAARLRGLTGTRALFQARARTVAEAGLERAEAGWDPIQAGQLPVGAATALPAVPSVDGAASRDTLLRLGLGLFMLRAVGEQRAPDGVLLARDAMVRLVRLEGPAVPDSIAASVGGSASITADSGILGGDAVPTSWDSLCPPPGTSGIGLDMPPNVTPGLTCVGGLCVSGTPPVATDSALPGGLFSRLGTASLPTLIARAEASVSGSLTVGPAFSGLLCDRLQSNNWGDPLFPGSQCGSYFPIVAAGPGTQVVGGAGQGLLLTTGSLLLGGGTRFFGVILAQGDLTLDDSATVYGAVMVQGSLFIAGKARVQRSRCAVERALEGAARPMRPVSRGTWRLP